MHLRPAAQQPSACIHCTTACLSKLCAAGSVKPRAVLWTYTARALYTAMHSVLLAASRGLPPEELEYGGVPWTASRTYVDEGVVTSPAYSSTRFPQGSGQQDLAPADAMAAGFAPLVAAVQAAVERRCDRRLRLESAFSTLYEVCQQLSILKGLSLASVRPGSSRTIGCA